MKKITMLIMAVTLGITILITGCGGGDGANQQSSGDSSENQPAEQVTLRFSWWGDDTRHKATLEAIKLFEEKYPNIKIQPEYAGWKLPWKLCRMTAKYPDWNLKDSRFC